MKKILVIEDDKQTLDVVEACLDMAGYAVIKVNREICIKEIAGIYPDLIIVDYQLPYGMGDQICLNIKNNPVTGNIPVVLYSASLLNNDLIEQCKADHFLAKPFDLEELLTIAQHFSMDRKQPVLL